MVHFESINEGKLKIIRRPRRGKFVLVEGRRRLNRSKS